MNRWRRLSLVLLALLIVGCPKEEDDGGTSNITFDDTGPSDDDGGTPDATMDAGSGTDATTPDFQFSQDATLDTRVNTPGFMNGEWAVTRASDDSLIATLRVVHEEGTTMLRGTYDMEDPSDFGRLAGTTWVDDTFTTSWTIDVEGANEQFGLSECAAGGDDLLDCRFSSTLAGDIVDAQMTRQ